MTSGAPRSPAHGSTVTQGRPATPGQQQRKAGGSWVPPPQCYGSTWCPFRHHGPDTREPPLSREGGASLEQQARLGSSPASPVPNTSLGEAQEGRQNLLMANAPRHWILVDLVKRATKTWCQTWLVCEAVARAVPGMKRPQSPFPPPPGRLPWASPCRYSGKGGGRERRPPSGTFGSAPIWPGGDASGPFLSLGCESPSRLQPWK